MAVERVFLGGLQVGRLGLVVDGLNLVDGHFLEQAAGALLEIDLGRVHAHNPAGKLPLAYRLDGVERPAHAT